MAERDMPHPRRSPGEIVQSAINSGRIEEGRSHLDAWQASQPVNRETLGTLRFYREALGQRAEAIKAAKAIIALPGNDTRESMSDQLSLGSLLVRAGDVHEAWDVLNVVLAWPELPRWYECGMVRSTIELALDICLTARDDRAMAERAFDAAMRLIDDGASTSLVILQKARDSAQYLQRIDAFERFSEAALQERKRIDAML